MALVEIEDQYLDQLRELQQRGVPLADRTAEYKRARDHEQFITNVGNNPKHRDQLLRLLKDTGTYVPELERTEQVRTEFEQKLDERLKPLDDFLKAQTEREQKAQERSIERMIEDGRSYLRKEGWDDDGVKEVETLMRDKSIGSYEVASKYLKTQKPDPAPLPTSAWNGRDFGSEWFNPPSDAPDHKLLLEDPRAFTNKEIHKFFKEKREGRLQLP